MCIPPEPTIFLPEPISETHVSLQVARIQALDAAEHLRMARNVLDQVSLLDPARFVAEDVADRMRAATAQITDALEMLDNVGVTSR
jgi:hypothetical protein